MGNEIKATQAQLKSPKWWDEHAPSDAEALLDFNQWVKWVHGEEFWWSINNPYWCSQAGNSWSAERYKGKPETFTLYERPVAEQKEKEWIPGVTLPPVGTKCHIHLTVPSFYQKTYPTVENGMEVEIIQHLDTGKGEVAVFKYLKDTDRDGYYYRVAQAVARCFVPLKTKEQIEEEETKRVIAQVVCDWLRQSSNINRFEKLDAIANLLYKEGLRIVK